MSESLEKYAKIQEFTENNVPISQLTTFKIGGNARYLVHPKNVEQLEAALDFAKTNNLPIYPIGSGSNILASDNGFNGVLIKMNNANIEVNMDKTSQITAGAGTLWDDLVKYSVDRDLAGLECMSAIPGTVGACPVQNIGAYGQEIAQTLNNVKAYNLETGNIDTIENKDCGFSYRTSNFKTKWRKRYIIISVTFDLTPSGAANIQYREVFLKALARNKEQRKDYCPTLKEVREDVLSLRKNKSMIVNEEDPNHRSAGSFYLNPVVPQSKGEELKAKYGELPVYPGPEGYVKLSAAWILEHAGFPKGYRLGKAGLSSHHVLAVINPGEATCRDILQLSEVIKKKVQESFQITLVAEPNLLGDF